MEGRSVELRFSKKVHYLIANFICLQSSCASLLLKRILWALISNFGVPKRVQGVRSFGQRTETVMLEPVSQYCSLTNPYLSRNLEEIWKRSSLEDGDP